MLCQPKNDTERHLFECEYWIEVNARFVDAKRTWDCVVEIARADSQDPEMGLEGPTLNHKVLHGNASSQAAIDAGLAHGEGWCRSKR
jgi:hypothetical protein